MVEQAREAGRPPAPSTPAVGGFAAAQFFLALVGLLAVIGLLGPGSST